MKLLYITFIDMNNSPKSGSAVRPLKMLQAFRTMDIEIIVLSGQDNKLNVRRRNVKKIKDKLKSWRPDICYIEPPSGPMFYYGDIRLIKMLHKERVPMSIFYRRFRSFRHLAIFLSPPATGFQSTWTACVFCFT